MSSGNIGFIGLGLIGGSLAKAIKTKYLSYEIVAYDTNINSLHIAMQEGIIDMFTTKIDDSFSDCDIIFLCAPVNNNIEAMTQLLPIISNNCIITDVGSTKKSIIDTAMTLDCGNYFIGGHPMTGSEKSGIKAANKHLFENAYYILTPLPSTPDYKVEALHSLITEIGALPVVIDPKQHDFITATISHVLILLLLH
jgi:prephenate dehydrogenase